MYFWINSSTETKFWIAFAVFCAIVLTFLCIVAIIEAIAERRENKRRKYGKRYTVEIRPERRY